MLHMSYQWAKQSLSRPCIASKVHPGRAHVHAACWSYNHSENRLSEAATYIRHLESCQGSLSSVDWEKAIKLWAACCREETRSTLLQHWISTRILCKDGNEKKLKLAALIQSSRGKLRERQWVKEKDGQRQSELRAQLSKLMPPAQVKKRLAWDAFGGVGLRQSDSLSGFVFSIWLSKNT